MTAVRELTVRIRFTRPALGNVKGHDDDRFHLMRTAEGAVMFLNGWHRQNLKMASQLLGRHQSDVDKVLWDVAVDAVLRPDRWFRRYYTNGAGRKRYAEHEAIMPGQIVGINCVVPSGISDDDMWQLMTLAGKYKGLSPYKPGEFGHFVVESIRPRRPAADAGE